MTVTQPLSETREQTFAFTLERSEQDSDGLTFEGYAAVFNSPTAIQDQDGDYTEVVAPGAFKRSLNRKTPVLMFDHGKHPMIGNIPIGKITDIREDPRGLYVKARLIDNPTINIVRDAIRAEAITGMSFRFSVKKDNWTARGRARTRTLQEVDVPEVGPVVFPAYSDTVASVRSAMRALAEQYPDVVQVTLRNETPDDEAPTVADLVSDAVEDLWGLSDLTSDAYIIDLFDDHAVFTVTGNGNVTYPGLWQVNYTFTDGNVTIAEPSHPALAGYMEGANAQVFPADIIERIALLESMIASASTLTLVGETGIEARASAADINDLPDSAFAYIEPGGTKDSSGKTTPRSKRHFPIHDAAHVRNALARMSQSPFGEKAKPAIMAAAKKFGIDQGMNSQDLSTSDELAAGASEELADRAARPMSKEQVIRDIQLRERRIALPKGA